MTRTPTNPTSRWLDNESRDLIQAFWQAAGQDEPFPRALEQSLAFALPVALVKLPRLTSRSAEQWARARGRDLNLATTNRPLHGCLTAASGFGIIFVDGTDPADEQRFTIAHEIGHFLADYLRPRRRALDRFGERFVDVLDGKRPPTLPEQVQSVIAGIAVGPYVNLMQRDLQGSDALELWSIENRADRIALALLAPPELVLDRDLGDRYPQRLETLTRVLTSGFGLPPTPALRYAANLLAECGLGPSLAESIATRPTPSA
jgi:hypothetical protein